LETWQKKIAPCGELFNQLLQNNEYEEFITMFLYIVENPSAQILLPWLADGLLKKAARSKQSQLYPTLLFFASPRALFESMQYDSNLRDFILDTVRDNPDHKITFPEVKRKGYINITDSNFPGLHSRSLREREKLLSTGMHRVRYRINLWSGNELVLFTMKECQQSIYICCRYSSAAICRGCGLHSRSAGG
jgi:hypothetical protein